MSQSHSIKGGSTDDWRFRCGAFCGREELLMVQALTVLTYKIFRNSKNTEAEDKKGKKHATDLF